MTPIPLAQGEPVRIRMRHTADWSNGVVYIASAHEALGIRLYEPVRSKHGLIGGFLPLFYNPETGIYTGLFSEQDEYEVERFAQAV